MSDPIEVIERICSDGEDGKLSRIAEIVCGAEPKAQPSSNSLLEDVLAFLKATHQADVIAWAEWDQMTKGKLPYGESHEAIKTFRKREALISRIESVSVETVGSDVTALRRVIERHVKWRETALGFLRQVIDGRGAEDEWPALADFIERSESRISASNAEKTPAALACSTCEDLKQLGGNKRCPDCGRAVKTGESRG